MSKKWAATEGASNDHENVDHKQVCGHPWPTFEGVFAKGSHWTPETYAMFITWQLACRDALRDFVYGPARHRWHLMNRLCAKTKAQPVMTVEDHAAYLDARKPPGSDWEERLDAQVSHYENCRQALVRKSGVSDPERLITWVVTGIKTMRRLASAGFIPHPPQGTLP